MCGLSFGDFHGEAESGVGVGVLFDAVQHLLALFGHDGVGGDTNGMWVNCAVPFL